MGLAHDVPMASLPSGGLDELARLQGATVRTLILLDAEVWPVVREWVQGSNQMRSP